ncbi:MAG: hypothetical protein PHE32_00885 [Candidatus Shapirobacteria bacterium]|nr:hypothetical protein [Candidatus Shapirobacteria bacterium]MDD4410247.1 hypothetical protein [Candidatus Shapirobacteria bacterium]
MTDHDRNVRTLILCFVLAIMALLPLRIIEVRQDIQRASSTQVLGETVQQESVVILPNGELNTDQLNYGDEITEKDLLY